MKTRLSAVSVSTLTVALFLCAFSSPAHSHVWPKGRVSSEDLKRFTGSFLLVQGDPNQCPEKLGVKDETKAGYELSPSLALSGKLPASPVIPGRVFNYPAIFVFNMKGSVRLPFIHSRSVRYVFEDDLRWGVLRSLYRLYENGSLAKEERKTWTVKGEFGTFEREILKDNRSADRKSKEEDLTSFTCQYRVE